MEAFTLVLTGNGTREQFLKAGIHPNSNTLFIGHVSDAQLRALYESAICFAYPSFTEGFGMPPLEAMRAGCPAIVAPCGALSEVCGDAAIYAGPHDSEGWKKAIIGMASDSVLRNQTIEKGRKRAAQFTWNRAAKQLLDIITETINAESA
jgi:glycosyltransferase involved in cell wall biosynthesis